MPPDRRDLRIYHITAIDNLPSIVRAGGLLSDQAMVGEGHEVIGYAHVKQRRLREIRVPCANNRFVGEFVPFYYCPRSPMLYTVNNGNSGKPAGCQKRIVHLVSTVGKAVDTGASYAISDGNAGAFHTAFSGSLDYLDTLDWDAIEATQWAGRVHEKSAEFLVADFFPWNNIIGIACFDEAAAEEVKKAIDAPPPAVKVLRNWYY